MPTVREELSRIHEDTDTLVSLAETSTAISRDVAEDLSRFSSEVQSALEDHSRATGEFVGQLDDRLRELRDRVVSAIEASGALIYKGQKEQANTISSSVVAAGFVGGLFSLLGTAIAGKLVSSAIEDAADRRPASSDELKERALLLLVARIHKDQSYMPVQQLIDRATGPSAILSSADVRRMLMILVADGVLERKADDEDAPLRIMPAHPKGRHALGDVVPTNQADSRVAPPFVDLGPEFGVSLSREHVERINHVRISDRKEGHVVVVDYSAFGYSRHDESRMYASREQAEAVRIDTNVRLLSNSTEGAATRRPASSDELKEQALLLLIARVHKEQSYIPVEQLVDRATGPSAILSSADVRRILMLLVADGVLERKADDEHAPLRINRAHSKGRRALGDDLPTKEANLRIAQPFVDLGPEFGVSLSREHVEKVNHIRISNRNEGYVVVVDYSASGYSRRDESRVYPSRERAEEVRKDAHARLSGALS